MLASSESCAAAHSSASTAFKPDTMKLVLNDVSKLLARLGRSLQALQTSLNGWAPPPAAVLVPIPIRAERHTHAPNSRHPDRDR
jgi:hypothetical protein